MNKVRASSGILNVYQTGDRPILILCSDGSHYICKYKHPGYSANNLTREMIGSTFAKIWGIATPVVSLVQNDSIIWDGSGISHDPEAPLLGSRKMETVFDLSSYNHDLISVTHAALNQLLVIALFDLWLANEDRTCNNYNLLYDMRLGRVVSIDYGGIFNSGILNRPIYQLNEYDSIISSDLYDWLKRPDASKTVSYLTFVSRVKRCKDAVPLLFGNIPQEWNDDRKAIETKLNEVFTTNWLQQTWNTFQTLVNKKL